MDEKDFVSFETARNLKAAGFSEKVTSVYAHVYKGEDGWRLRNGYIEDDYNHYEWLNISAPTLWQAQKWLRETKGIAVNVIAHDGGKYDYEIIFLPNSADYGGLLNCSPWCITYEDALSAGIDAALDLLTKT